MASCNTDLGHIYVKTKMCSFFQKGLCTKGSACTFAHSLREQRAKPDLSRTKMCSAFLSGSCKAGFSCCFAHHESALRVFGKKNRQRRKQQPSENASGDEVTCDGGSSAAPSRTHQPRLQVPTCDDSDVATDCGESRSSSRSETDGENSWTMQTPARRPFFATAARAEEGPLRLLPLVFGCQDRETSNDSLLPVRNTFVHFEPVGDLSMCMRRLKSEPAVH